MGGNALKSGSTRLEKGRYLEVEARCVRLLQERFPGNRIAPIESYRAKADFGDLDILIESTAYDPVSAAAMLSATEVVRNGPVTSVGVLVDPAGPVEAANIFQVDLIKSSPEEFSYALGYFKANDCGNLAGRIAHSMGLAHRHDGLVYYCRDGDHKFKEIVLTRDYAEALTFLGLDADRFAQGFDELEDIFRFIVASEFFNPDIYLLHNVNAVSRIRDRKRTTYMKFLAWLRDRPGINAYAFPADKQYWLERLFAFFPAFKPQYEDALAALAKQRAVKAKFGGGLVGEWTGLSGQALGTLLQEFRNSFVTPQDLQSYVLGASEAQLRERTLQLKNQLAL